MDVMYEQFQEKNVYVGFINKNKHFLEKISRTNIFEDDFDDVEEEMEEMEEFLKEHGEILSVHFTIDSVLS